MPLNIAATHEVLARRGATAIAPGFTPDPALDLTYDGGRIVASATVVPIFVGGWSSADTEAVTGALAAALADRGLESVMGQYFPEPPVVTVAPHETLTDTATTIQQSDVETMATQAHDRGLLTSDPAATLACFLLPRGVRLFTAQGDDSFHGLGGYHGSVSASDGTTVYYATGVYSDTEGPQTNGIVGFPDPWKNVVATFYHEINEWRTDPDVERATGSGTGVLGWYSQQGGEVGDIPITQAAGDLAKVFVEASRADGQGTVPVQLMWSNADHGPAQSTTATPGPLPQAGG